jgi:hypothetical protein
MAVVTAAIVNVTMLSTLLPFLAKKTGEHS